MSPFSLTVLMYHYIRDPGDRAEAGSGIPGWPTAHFEAQLDDLTQRYTFVDWPAVRAQVLGQKVLPPNAALLTFDDGVCDHYLNVFPILHRRGLSGLFFALARNASLGLTLPHKIHFLLARFGLTELRAAIRLRLNLTQREMYESAEKKYQAKGYGAVDVFKSILQRDLSAHANVWLSDLFAKHIGDEATIAADYFLKPEQVREMVAGRMHFGGHSQTHPWFDWIDEAQQIAEAQASAQWLSHIEPGPWAFAYPYGGLNEFTPRPIQAAGFAAAFTTQTHTTHTDPMLIGRLDGEELPITNN
jgi:hypothetical protein